MENQITYHWELSTYSGLQFKSCQKYKHTNTLKYHFNCVNGDIIECEKCKAKHEIFALF